MISWTCHVCNIFKTFQDSQEKYYFLQRHSKTAKHKKNQEKIGRPLQPNIDAVRDRIPNSPKMDPALSYLANVKPEDLKKVLWDWKAELSATSNFEYGDFCADVIRKFEAEIKRLENNEI